MSAQHGFARKHQQGFQCKCSQSFTRMFTLRNHIRACANERLYACDFDACTKAFVRRTDLMSHKKTHSDDKPYKCDGEEGCGKSFARLFNLKRHLRTCSGCKPCSDEEEEREGPNATRTKSIKRETTQIRSCDLGLQDNPYHSDIQCLESCKDLFASLIPTVMSQMAYSPTRLKSTLDLIKHSMDDLFEVAFRMQQEARDNQNYIRATSFVRLLDDLRVIGDCVPRNLYPQFFERQCPSVVLLPMDALIMRIIHFFEVQVVVFKRWYNCDLQQICHLPGGLRT